MGIVEVVFHETETSESAHPASIPIVSHLAMEDEPTTLEVMLAFDTHAS